MRPSVAGGLLLAACAAVMSAQQPAVPAFEVASVKPNVSGDAGSSSLVMRGGRYVATNVTLRMLMKTAYQVHDDQIVDGPGWIDQDRFDVTAQAAGNPEPSAFITQARLMIRPLLADRFKLAVRQERREIPVYTLERVRSDGTFGPQFRRHDPAACPAGDRAVPAAAGAAEAAPTLLCNGTFVVPGHVGGRGRDIAMLIGQLRNYADRVIVDRTGLNGLFDWDLQWTEDRLAPGAAASGVSVFTALREQLGVRLEPRREVADVLVIERVERPQPD